MTEPTPPVMRTRRRYAHELYPHPAEDEFRPLAVDVPYLYARALGFAVMDTGWSHDRSPEGIERDHQRMMILIGLRQMAMLTDALLQGMTGDAAWRWAEERSTEESGEWVWQRALHYGVDPERIKPYPCGPEPDRHWHRGAPIADDFVPLVSVEGRESECPDCCEPDDGSAS